MVATFGVGHGKAQDDIPDYPSPRRWRGPRVEIRARREGHFVFGISMLGRYVDRLAQAPSGIGLRAEHHRGGAVPGEPTQRDRHASRMQALDGV